VVDRLRQGEKWRNIAKREVARIIHPDRLFGFLDAHAHRIRAIFHMGAISTTTETDADLINASNVDLTLDLFAWCARHGVRLIYASSAATYGDGAQGFDDANDMAALARLRPLNAYGWSKHLVDRRIARWAADGRPMPPQWVGLKFFNVYGPNEYHKGAQQSVVAHVHRKVAAGEPAQLFRSHNPNYADGGQLRDFIWVGDVVEVMLWLLDHPAVSGLFNLGTGTARSFLDLATAVFTARGLAPDIRYIDTPEAIRAKYQYFTQAPMERLRAAGYTKPFTPLEQGITEYVTRYLATEDPYL
ncbi:MAG TPA: ADP-glyceromanno-heptose 6-epimerase, partial [Stellaceae bacterium]|nr:ADP-glyceromanno-heptose 6-epimerase [Stellaceae bacterium]